MDSAAKPRFASPDSYTPKHLAEKILTSKAALEGERKQVTVLFADLKGSMELLADRDPEEARKLLDPVLERMMEAVHRYEGTVNQVMGDGIMALFGAPVAQEDHAVRACYAALRMHESVARYADELRQQGLDVQIRVGLNSGEVVVRSIGSDLRMDYTAVGQTTHLAARMEQFARPGTTLVTAEVLRLAEGYVTVKPLGPVAVKGVGAPVEVYEVTGAGPVHTRLQALVARQLSRFVARDAELDQLRQALDKASAGRGQVVALVGEPGVGKSRLFHEFTRLHRARSWLVVAAGSVSYGKATPYLPVIDLLRAYFQIEAQDDTRKIREKVTGKVLSLDRQLEPSLPAVLSLLDVTVEDEQWQRLAAPQRRHQILDGVKRLLLRESQVEPLLVLFEDLHWIDSETQTLLDMLVESLPTARLLLLVNYRPEYQHGWSSKTYYRQLRIDALPAESADDLLTSLLGTEKSLAALKRTLIERTEGNPLFLEESVRTLVETGALAGGAGAYRLVQPIRLVQVPATVQGILAARIDRLESEVKYLLQSASVIGRDVPFALLQAIAALPEDTLRRHLTDLQAAEFLYETSLFPELRYTFKHALTHEVAYASLLQERRRAVHTRIVEAIEAAYPDRLVEQVERLANHTVGGELWEKAVPYLRQAGTKAAAHSAPREAVVWFEQALDALRHLPDGRHALEQGVDLRLEIQAALLPAGELGSVLRYLGEAETLAEALSDQGRLGRISAHLTFCLWWTGDLPRAVAAGQRALAFAAAHDDSPLEIVTNLRLAQVYATRGEYRRAIDYFRNVDRLVGGLVLEQFGLPDLPAVTCRDNMASCLSVIGDFANATAAAEEGLRIAKACDNRYSLALAYRGVARPYLARGNFETAVSQLERSLDICETEQFSLLMTLVAPYLGKAYAMSGRVPEGVSLLERTAQQSGSLNLMATHPRDLIYLGQSYLMAGRPSDAMESAQRALQLAGAHQQQGHAAEAMWLTAEISASEIQPGTSNAEDHYRAALALANQLGMRPLVAHCHLGLGKLYERTGKRARAHEHLTTATTMYRDMDMDFWLEKAQAEMRGMG